jgi:two-component system, cell cycle sensor histidine kinase and response regulator CckA
MPPMTSPPHILVADDDGSLRVLLRHTLTRAGLTPVLVRDGAAAVAAVQQHGTTFACALLDLELPQLDGIATARALRQLAPNLPIIIMTGRVLRDTALNNGQLQSVAVLAKPFSIATLLAALEQATGLILPAS